MSSLHSVILGGIQCSICWGDIGIKQGLANKEFPSSGRFDAVKEEGQKENNKRGPQADVRDHSRRRGMEKMRQVSKPESVRLPFLCNVTTA